MIRKLGFIALASDHIASDSRRLVGAYNCEVMIKNVSDSYGNVCPDSGVGGPHPWLAMPVYNTIWQTRKLQKDMGTPLKREIDRIFMVQYGREYAKMCILL